MWIKIVPKVKPNGPGEWKEVDLDLGVMHGELSWQAMEEQLKDDIPDTHFMVSYSKHESEW